MAWQRNGTPVTLSGTQEVYTQAGNLGGANAGSSFNTRVGTLLQAGFSGIDASIKKITFNMKKVGTPTGTMTYTVRDTGDTIKSETETFDVSTIPTDFTDIELTLADTIVIESGDRVLVEYSGGDGGSFLQIQDHNSQFPANTQESLFSGSYAQSARGIDATFDSDPTFTPTDTLSIADLTPLSFNEMLTHQINIGNMGARIRLNDDSAANYAWRAAFNGVADLTFGNQTQAHIYTNINTGNEFDMAHIMNISNEEKLFIGFGINSVTLGPGTAPARSEAVAKWVNTSVQFTRLDNLNQESGSFNTGSNESMLGTD